MEKNQPLSSRSNRLMLLLRIRLKNPRRKTPRKKHLFPFWMLQHGQKLGGIYSVEVGSFLSSTTAQTFAVSLQDKGCPAEIFGDSDASGRKWFHVRVGHYENNEKRFDGNV